MIAYFNGAFINEEQFSVGNLDRAFQYGDGLFETIAFIIGTSLVVYPTASFIYYVSRKVPVFVIDPNKPSLTYIKHNITFIEEEASVGVEKLKEMINKNK